MDEQNEGFLDDEPRYDDSEGGIPGCPTCGNEDIQSAELLEAWNTIKQLEKDMQVIVDAPPAPVPGFEPPAIPPGQTEVKVTSEIDWQARYNKLKAAYIKTRLEVSGSFGNWDFDTKKRVLEKEISAEVGFTV